MAKHWITFSVEINSPESLQEFKEKLSSIGLTPDAYIVIGGIKTLPLELQVEKEKDPGRRAALRLLNKFRSEANED